MHVDLHIKIIIKCAIFTSHTVIIPKEPVIISTSTSVLTTSSHYHSKSI